MVKCDNCGTTFINRQRRRKHFLKSLPIVNGGIEAEHEVMQDLVHCIEYINFVILARSTRRSTGLEWPKFLKSLFFSVSLFSSTFFINPTAV